MQTTNKIYR